MFNLEAPEGDVPLPPLRDPQQVQLSWSAPPPAIVAVEPPMAQAQVTAPVEMAATVEAATPVQTPAAAEVAIAAAEPVPAPPAVQEALVAAVEPTLSEPSLVVDAAATAAAAQGLVSDAAAEPAAPVVSEALVADTNAAPPAAGGPVAPGSAPGGSERA